jgi:CRP-like cAMP-binding protein
MGGDQILRQFGRDTDLMVVLKGAALIKTFSGDPIAEVGPGSVLGEISLIDTEPRSATVAAKGECTVAVIPSSGLQNLMRHDIGMRCVMMENLAKVLCQRLRTANVQLDGAMAASAR